jgi:hypothetical protein
MEEFASVEKVLNSRCSCDFDGDPKKNHWGMFAKDKYPPAEILEHVLRCLRKSPQFSGGKLSFWYKDNYLYLGFEMSRDSSKNDLLHIESGMQHELVYLACTALGVGTCIYNLGIDGTVYGNKIATAKHLILENVGGYSEGKFTIAAPGPERPFRRGRNLSEPKRDGSMECLSELEQLTLSRNTGTQAGEGDISQLLWAARGRTPHYVKSHPWGLTIPTWGGGQNYTSVYLMKENKLFQYINWTAKSPLTWWTVGNPIHDVRFLKNVFILTQLEGASSAIILSRNEETNRALWEVGYMLENMLLQAKSLEVSYKSKIFTNDETEELRKSGIPEAVATLLL